MFEMPPKCPGGRAPRARRGPPDVGVPGDQSTLPAYELYFGADPSSDEAQRSPIRRVYPAMKTSNHATMNSSGLHSILGGGRGGHVRA